jgi:transcriptional regulator with XRE-family HTH domain
MASPFTVPQDFVVRVRLAYWLRSLRTASNLTQEEVGALFDPPLRTNEISRYENAHSKPSDRKLMRFAEIYNVDVSELFAPLPDEEERRL